ncbi:TRAP transporter small permease [Alkalihalobacillus sp. BA299]|uniref:TRAP transporter small permease n=1 Tax=Alkalihalobacillus sp. BA299 TaxID=2815938 RepID=UPI001ADC5BE7|nr:TRAP transporter small permease [Alkalihalobacillus sp. BA299]
MLNKIGRTYVKTENFITDFLMIGVVFFVFIASVMRWAGSPIPWSVEFAQLLFVWVIFLGANRALREDRHIGVDFFTKKLPDRLRVTLEILMMLLVMGFLIFIGYFGILLSIENSVRLISNLTMSYSFVTLSVPIGCILMIFTILIKIKEKIMALKTVSNS